MAANIGKGIDAKNAPNFPERHKVVQLNDMIRPGLIGK